MSNRGLGTLSLSLAVKLGAFTDGLSKADRDLQKRAGSMEARARKMGTAIGIALAAAGTAAALGVKEAIEAADKLNDISAKLGIGVEKLSAWSYAAGQAGTDIGALETGLTKFNKAIAEAQDGTSSQADVFKALGISVEQASTAADLLPTIADRFAGIESAATKTKLAMELFGKSGAELIPLLSEGASGLAELETRAAQLGIVLDTETTKAAGEFKDRMEDVDAITNALWKQLAGALLPSLQRVAGMLQETAQEGVAAGGAMESVGSAASSVVTYLDKLNTVGKGTVMMLAAMKDGSIQALEALAAVQRLDFKGAAESYRKASQNADRAQFLAFNDLPDFSNVRGSPKQAIFAGIDADPSGLFKEVAPKFDTSVLDKYLSGVESRGGTAAKAVRSVNAALREHAELIPEIDRKALENEQAVMDWQSRLEDLQASMAGPVAEALLDQDRKVRELQSAYAAGQMSVADFTEWQRLLADQLAATTGALGEQADFADSLYEMQSQWDFVQDASTDALADILSGSKSARDAVDDLAQSITRMLSQWASNKIMESLFGMLGGSPASQGQSVIDAFEGLFGGGMASGGIAAPNKLFEVNERGFEMATAGGRDYMLTGSKPVQITPNHRLGGGGVSVNVTQVIQGNMTNRTGRQAAREAGQEAQRALSRYS